MEDRGGKIWISGRNTIAVYNPVTFTVDVMDGWKELTTAKEDIHFFGLQEDESGLIRFAGIPFGIGEYNQSNGKFSKLEIGGEFAKRGIGTFPLSLYRDQFGVYWIGLADNGILKFDPKRSPFRFYSFDEENINQTQLSIASDIKFSKNDKNEIFIASNREGIYSLDLTAKKMKNLNIPLPSIYSDSSNLFKIVIDDSENLWFSSRGLYLANYNLKTGKVKSYLMKKGSNVTGVSRINDLEYIPQNNIVVSSNLGIQILNSQTGLIEDLPSVSNRRYSQSTMNQIREIVEEKEPIAALVRIGEAANETQTFDIKEESDFLIIGLGEGIYPPKSLFDYGLLSDKEGKPIWKMDSISNTFYAGGGFKNRIMIDILKLEPGQYSLRFSTDVGHSFGNWNVDPPEDSTWYGIQIIQIDKSLADELNKKLQLDEKSVPDFFGAFAISSSKKYPNTIWIGAQQNGIIHYDSIFGKI